MQCIGMWSSMLHFVVDVYQKLPPQMSRLWHFRSVCRNVLQCVAMCCNVLQCVADFYQKLPSHILGLLQCGTGDAVWCRIVVCCRCKVEIATQYHIIVWAVRYMWIHIHAYEHVHTQDSTPPKFSPSVIYFFPGFYQDTSHRLQKWLQMLPKARQYLSVQTSLQIAFSGVKGMATKRKYKSCNFCSIARTSNATWQDST